MLGAAFMRLVVSCLCESIEIVEAFVRVTMSDSSSLNFTRLSGGELDTFAFLDLPLLVQANSH